MEPDKAGEARGFTGAESKLNQNGEKHEGNGLTPFPS
jgi:hypothetical protein